jgi:hypothetical protein
MARQTEHSKCKYIVSKFCLEPQFVNWGKEINIAKKLLKAYPEMGFWEKIPPRDYGNTLSFFLTSEGKSFLVAQKKLLQLKIEEPEQYELSDKKILKNEKAEKKNPKTLMEFLRDAKEI